VVAPGAPAEWRKPERTDFLPHCAAISFAQICGAALTPRYVTAPAAASQRAEATVFNSTTEAYRLFQSLESSLLPNQLAVDKDPISLRPKSGQQQRARLLNEDFMSLDRTLPSPR
jgi:hypothetical protein